MAVAIGLAGSTDACGDAFLSVGLRRSNSVLALLTDKYNLDFSDLDDEAEMYAESKIEAEEAFWSEVDRLPVRGDSSFARLQSYREFVYGDLSDTCGDESEAIFFGGEEDVEPKEPLSLDELGVIDGSSEVLRRAIGSAVTEKRRILETFDLVEACALSSEVAAIFDSRRLTEFRLRQEINRYRALEPFSDNQKIALSFDGGRIRVRTFGLLDGYEYESRTVGPEQLIVQLTTPSAFVLKSTLDEFEELINWQAVSERDIHRFINKHPELLLGDQYAQLHSELILDAGDQGQLIPDFFAELTTSDYVDIIDLKKPNEKLLAGRKNRRGFSAAVNSAIYQLRAYRDYFDDSRRRKEFYSRHGLHAFRPRIAVIIGRTPPYTEAESFIESKRSVADAEVVTYDEIIERARRRLIRIEGR